MTTSLAVGSPAKLLTIAVKSDPQSLRLFGHKLPLNKGGPNGLTCTMADHRPETANPGIVQH